MPDNSRMRVFGASTAPGQRCAESLRVEQAAGRAAGQSERGRAVAAPTSLG